VRRERGHRVRTKIHFATLFGLDLDQYPNVERWLEAIASRPATERAYAIAKDMNQNAPQPVRRAEREAAKATA
jgi:glutathione S-transferase